MAHNRVNLQYSQRQMGAYDLRLVGTVTSSLGHELLSTWVIRVDTDQWYVNFPFEPTGEINLTTLKARDPAAAVMIPFAKMNTGEVRLFLWGPGSQDDGFVQCPAGKKLAVLDEWAANSQFIAPKMFTAPLWEQARKVLVNRLEEANLLTEPEKPIGPRKPPRTVIVQEWAPAMEEKDPGEIARRAWEATIAACKGEPGSRS